MNALELVWGVSTTDYGESAATHIDYTPLFDYVRSRLGAPIVPVELTDEQLSNILSEAIYDYNKYRNFSEHIEYATLPSDMRDGYELPPTVGGPENLIEIILKPKMPFGYYTSDPDMANNLFMQYMFQKVGRPTQNGFLTDYTLALSTQKDMNLILGTEVRWQVINRKLFIFPRPSSSIIVGIKYRSPLSYSDIMTDMTIKRYMVAAAKVLLGTIRSTFGGVIPGGTENIQLNSSELIQQGTAELQEIKDSMRGQMEPLDMLIG